MSGESAKFRNVERIMKTLYFASCITIHFLVEDLWKQWPMFHKIKGAETLMQPVTYQIEL